MIASALVLVTSSFPMSGDGSEAAGSFVSDLVDELAKAVPVRVVAPGPTSLREFRANGVEVFRYSAPLKPLSTLRPWHPREFIEIARVMRSGKRACHEAATAGPTGHILALWALPCGDWARNAAHKCGIPYSVWTLGSDIWTLGRIPVVRSILRRVLRQATVRFSDGLKLSDDTSRISGRQVEFLPSTRRIDSHRTVSLAESPPYRFLFLGRWHANKGVDLLLDALGLLDEEDWKRIECVDIQGGGPMDKYVRERVLELEAQGRPVSAGHFLGKKEAEVSISSADWLLIPSRIESIPVVFSDAMKLGAPVLVTPVGDMTELVGRHQCGISATAVTAEAIAECMKSALSIGPGPFHDGIRTVAELFDLDKIASRVQSLSGIRTHV